MRFLSSQNQIKMFTAMNAFKRKEAEKLLHLSEEKKTGVLEREAVLAVEDLHFLAEAAMETENLSVEFLEKRKKIKNLIPNS